jgi:hypothetical protein
MVRRYETRDAGHARAVARALLDAADDPHQVRTVGGDLGRQAFEVDDDFPEIDVPEPAPQGEPERAPRGPRRRSSTREKADSSKGSAADADQKPATEPRATKRSRSKGKQGDDTK